MREAEKKQFCSECFFALDYRHRSGCSRAGEVYTPKLSEVDALKAQIAELQAKLLKPDSPSGEK